MLYHGTCDTYLKSILSEGLKPRSLESNGNWEKAPSKEGLVYLTNSYAMYFAFAAAGLSSSGNPVILEIDEKALDFPNNFLPDEDALQQIDAHLARHGKPGIWGADRKKISKLSAIQQTFLINPRRFPEFAKPSLEVLGNVSYDGTIPVEAIKRVAIIDRDSMSDWVCSACDPTISIMNYLVMGEYYRSFTKFVFNPRVKFSPTLYGVSAGNLDSDAAKELIENDRVRLKQLLELRKRTIKIERP